MRTEKLDSDVLVMKPPYRVGAWTVHRMLERLRRVEEGLEIQSAIMEGPRPPRAAAITGRFVIHCSSSILHQARAMTRFD